MPIIPSDRLYPWQNAGMLTKGGPPTNRVVNTTLAAGDGVTDDVSRIQTAINACPAGQIVQLAAGVFICNSGSIVINSGITLQGAGPGRTFLRRTNGAVGRLATPAPNSDGTVFLEDPNGYIVPDFIKMIRAGPSLDPRPDISTAVALTADAAPGDTSVTVSSGTGFTVGQFVLLDELTNSSWQADPRLGTPSEQIWRNDRVAWEFHLPLMAGDECAGSNSTNPFDTTQANGITENAPAVTGGFAPAITVQYSRYDRVINEIKEVAGVSGNTITFGSPVSIAYRVANTAQLCRYTTTSSISGLDGRHITGVGVEELTLSGGTDGGIQFMNCAYSWIKHVEITQWLGYGVQFVGCFRCDLRDSYIHTGTFPVNTGGGYNIVIDQASSELLVENNISYDTNKTIVARAAGAGCVVGYNYMDDAWKGDLDTWQEVAVNASHLTGPHHVLFEGNYGQNFDSDFTFGSSIYHTCLRNQFSGKRRSWSDDHGLNANFGNARCAALGVFSWNFSFIGNILGHPNMPAGFSYTAPSMACDANGDNCLLTGTMNGDGGGGFVFRIGYDPLAETQNQSSTPEPTTNSTCIRDGNWDFVTGSQKWHTTPATFVMPTSLYLSNSGRPSFFYNARWPWIEPSNGTIYLLPAKARFDVGTPNQLGAGLPGPPPVRANIVARFGGAYI